MKKSIFSIITIFTLCVFVLTSCQKDVDMPTQTDSTQSASSFKTILDSLPPLSNGGVESRAAGLRWQIAMSGRTDNVVPFQRTGILMVVPTIRAAGGTNANNGVNPNDVAIVSGTPPQNPSAGSIWFGSNTGMCSVMGLPCGIVPSAIDVVYMYWANSSTLVIDIDGRFVGTSSAGTALLSNLNTINAKSGMLANVFRINSGRITLTFQRDGSVTGQIAITGAGIIYPGYANYAATFRGVRY